MAVAYVFWGGGLMVHIDKGKVMQRDSRWFSALLVLCLVCFLLPLSSFGDTHYVSTNGLHISPFTNWVDAANNIQAAVDVTVDGDLVLVSNGVYETGGRAISASLTNRVAIDRAVTVRSVNGAATTIIKGKGPLGKSAVRCMLMVNGAVLDGFTLTNGHTDSLFAKRSLLDCDTLDVTGYHTSGDIIYDDGGSGGGVWCQAGAVVSNCVVAENRCCFYGGGVFRGSLFNTTVANNSCIGFGGGTYECTLNGCRVIGNAAFYGGGAYDCTLERCDISYNSAETNIFSKGSPVTCTGGGADASRLNNCILDGNTAAWKGGGVYGSTVKNCTLIGNSASVSGGGANGGSTLMNSILWYNSAPVGANWSSGSLRHCCTTPLPVGEGNIDEDPLLASLTHLSAESPCIAMGSTNYSTGVDIDGEPWASPPSIGCDEYLEGSVTGILVVAIEPALTSIGRGLEVDFTAVIEGRVSGSEWVFGDGTVESNRPLVSRSWSTTGSYSVVLTAFNESNPGGVSATVNVEVVNVPVYVSLEGEHVYPFASWKTAANNIQDAIDANVPDVNLILVTNGVYDSGGRAMHGSMTNRVVIDRSITVRSVNGPADTTIAGEGPLGDGAVRCVYVGTNATLDGFTLTDGFTRTSGDQATEQSGGGAWCENSGVVSNCLLVGNSASDGGGVHGGTLYDCTITGNTCSVIGGGVHESTLHACTLSGNSASHGGGAYRGTVHNCTIIGNTASVVGGGVYESTLYACTLSSNSASYGGGAYIGTLHDCTISSNSATWDGGASYSSALNNCLVTRNSSGQDGGGSWNGTLNSCVVYGNSAENDGGGAYGATLNNCTITDNSANSGGGVSGGTLRNCVVWYNSASTGVNWNASGPSMAYCCTTPLPEGEGNIDQDPLLSSFSHLSSVSPCISQGDVAFATGMDIDGEAWSDPPSMGCDEYWEGAVTGDLSVVIEAVQMTSLVHEVIDFIACVDGRTTGSCWDWGDGTTTSNRPYVSHSWSTDGTYAVTLTAFNETFPEGVSTTVTVSVVAVQYVSPFGSHVSPFNSWATAATSIQAAVDVEVPGVDLILVTNGVYDTGGRAVYGSMNNRVVIDRPVTVRSVNGPDVTIIKGHGPIGNGAFRCAYVATNAVLDGFTLTNGFTRSAGNIPAEQSGGGVWCQEGAVVSNCIIAGNQAAVDAGGAYAGALFDCLLAGNEAGDDGGGAYMASLSNCELRDNVAVDRGGGATDSTLQNCTMVRNSASDGGGAHGGEFYNCLIYDNEASDDGGGVDEAIIINNCTITYNNAFDEGGGVRSSIANNCIIWYNAAAVGNNYFEGSLSFSCSAPLPIGTGNISAEPLLVDAMHLSSNSPCIGLGSVAYTNGLDIDGESWADPPSMGCDEYRTGGATGELSVAIESVYTTFSRDYEVEFTGLIEGEASGNWWDWGDGTTVSNQPQSSHAWSTTGMYEVIFTAFNDTYPSGVSATTLVEVIDLLTHHVNWSNSTPSAPYTTWSTAASNIQDAVDAANTVGAMVLVTNGTYDIGGRVVHGSMTNRVAIDRPITVSSVNGPKVTIIKGKGPLGNGAVRCVYVGTNAFLSGFTLTNGFTRKTGDFAAEQGGGGAWCEGSAVVSNCVIAGNNSFGDGGGSYKGRLVDCLLLENEAGDDGGGSWKGTLSNCELRSNHADDHGGGANGGILQNCTIVDNSAVDGGGVHESDLDSCFVLGNTASDDGGGIDESTMINNCVIAYNTANDDGGGARKSVLNNCTLVDNQAYSGGGARECTLNNSILWNNSGTEGANWHDCTLSYCATTPHPGGVGNITDDPQFMATDDFRLSSSSPCIDVGSNALASGSTDLIGLPRIINGTVDMGAYESETHAFSPIHYVSPAGANQYPYTNWAGAATTIQAAIDVAQSNDLVLVTNGLYNTGGAVAPGYSLLNRVCMKKPVTLRSVDGPDVTTIEGMPGSNGTLDVDAMRGVYMSAGCALIGFTVSNGYTRETGEAYDLSGGGIFLTSECIVSNCILAGNSAVLGGGAYHGNGGVLSDCTASGNWAQDFGGGVYLDFGGSLFDCVISSNSADLYGGGVRIYFEGEIHDSVIDNNSAGSVGGGLHMYIGGNVDNCTLSSNTAYSGGGGVGFTVGGALSNCVLRANTATGSSWTSGGGAYMAGGGQLVECTLIDNSSGHGGGVFFIDGGSLTRCVLTSNAAAEGGGAYFDADGVLENCLLTGNSATYGGGARLRSSGTLTGCALVGNSATTGGGVDFNTRGTLDNCVVWGNTGSTGADIHDVSGTIRSSCASDGLSHGLDGCITNAPRFVASNDFRLAASSPCIDAGSNALAAGSTDLDGSPRIVNGTVDMGVYEYLWPDTDEDGLSDRHEYFAGTSDTNPASCLIFEDIASDSSNGIVVTWQGVEGKLYGLYRSTNLMVDPVPLQTNIPGVEPMNVITDTTAVGYGPWYYRVILE